MELRHLRYFAAVAAELNFSRAAEKLHIAQPPLSRQIRQLEDEIGAQLIDRSARPLRLTPAGQFLLGQALQLLERVAEVSATTARIAAGAGAWLNVGFVPSALYGVLPDVIRRFRDAYPAVEVGLSELTTLQQIDALNAGRIDIGFGRLRFDDSRIVGEVMADERVVAALPANHPLALSKRLTLARLVPQTLLLYPAKPRPSYADQVLEMFRSRGLRPAAVLEANEMQTAIGLVVAGIGYALVPQSVQTLQRAGLVYRPLADADVTSPVIMNCRAGDTSSLVRAFRDMALSANA